MIALEQLIWVVPLLPLAAFFWIGLGQSFGWNRGESGERETRTVANDAALLALLLMVAIDLKALFHGFAPQVLIGHWFESGPFRISLSFTLDTLGLSMGTVVALISLITLRFSVNYLHREAGYQRFFMLLSLFTSAMLLIVLAGNAGLLFAGWEMAGVSSYLLIAYNYSREPATKNATHAFVTNRLGDAGLLAGIFFSTLWVGSIEWPQLLGDIGTISGLHLGLIAAAFLLAAFVKSAQIPFSSWISRALEGPTPSSAIFYGSLMVHAGVYLALRLQPLIEHSPPMALLLLVVGATTALYGYLVGLVQTDVKSALIFSTLTQVGLMFVGIGLGWFDAVLLYLIFHAIWRSWQFLNAPSYMHRMHNPTRPVPGWLQPLNRLYAAAVHRFWLDPLSHWLLVRPTQRLSKDLHAFDARVVRPIIGIRNELHVISSLAEWEKQSCQLQSSRNEVPRGNGLFGTPLQRLADGFVWIEQHMILQGGGEGLIATIKQWGQFITRIEEQLSMPRYLLLMIMATFVVVL
jgi:NADH:ubiquinone oxidoreductase subunit 5 (subunit L)/multisubunit Na+/H+ antiporter MnhA subunit